LGHFSDVVKVDIGFCYVFLLSAFQAQILLVSRIYSVVSAIAKEFPKADSVGTGFQTLLENEWQNILKNASPYGFSKSIYMATNSCQELSCERAADFRKSVRIIKHV
jgi:hypothetical protein